MVTHVSQTVLSVGSLALAVALAVVGGVWVVADEIQGVRSEVNDKLAVIDSRLDAIAQQQVALNERHAAMARNIERIERHLDDLPRMIAQELRSGSIP